MSPPRRILTNRVFAALSTFICLCGPLTPSVSAFTQTSVAHENDNLGHLKTETVTGSI